MRDGEEAGAWLWEHGWNEVWRLVAEFKASHPMASREVTVKIFRGGPSAEQDLWRVEATDDNGNLATGNPEATLDLALSTTHWQELNDDARRTADSFALLDDDGHESTR